MSKPWWIEASKSYTKYDLPQWMLDSIREAIREEANKLGVEAEDYRFDNVTVEVTAYKDS